MSPLKTHHYWQSTQGMATDEKQPSNRTQNVYAFSPKFQHSVNAGSQKVFAVLVILDGKNNQDD